MTKQHGACALLTLHTHSEYVILIAVPRQQWLRERASTLRYTHIAYLAFCEESFFFR
jgi:hypothetical protein